MTQKARRTGDQLFAGPPPLRPWYTMDQKRDASPCVLGRKFVAVRTRHRDLAEAEACLRAGRTDPKTTPRMMEKIIERRDNSRAWLDFTVASLEEHLRFAVARYDGSLDEVRPLASGKPRKGFANEECVKARALVDYYRATLDEFKLAAAASAGSWTRSICSAGKPCDEYRSGTVTMKKYGKTIVACKHIIADNERRPIGGHAGTDEATKQLITSARSVIEVVKARSGREPEVAEQLAWIELLDTAARFDPTAANMARFNTFYTYRARRATQIRSANDCPPGLTRIKGKIVAHGTIHVDDDHDASLLHPSSLDTVSDDNDMKSNVTAALASLSKEEQEIANLYLIGNVSLRDLAEQKNLTLHQVRRLVAGVTGKLQAALKSYAKH